MQHNSGFYGNKKFTSAANDWVEFLQITCVSLGQARKIEAHIKKMKSRHYIHNLKRYPEMISQLKLKYPI
jgi:putative endonuclease